ncbi:hypothetical protein [Polyangium sp. 15x6]|uniref:hypothetical protein n=1 Tax=Polyangium sp. 15x6 TaxID=3042687 RepID=UPI00249AB273|nr:hypothetical protein [Polyangium sp. 15x6]MDI3288184.1 hypothetical protein [Polyangium sp. 15x6]
MTPSTETKAGAKPPSENAPVTPSAETKAGSSPPAAAPPSTAACDTLRAEVRDALGKAQAKSAACKTEADCEILSDGICMAASCGVSIAKAARATYEADRKRITEPACESWTKSGCDKLVPIPIPSCPMLVPICKDGVCTSRY